MKIGKFEINNKKSFIIAEIGNNHNGDVNKAYEMIDLAIDAGADCVKFQMRHLNQVYRDKTLKKDGEDLGTEYLIDLLNRFELSLEEHKKVADYCRKKGVLYLCTPWDHKSIEILESLNVEAYKVASADLTNLPLIDSLIQTKKPLILSTGMSTEEEVKCTIEFLNSKSAEFALLHCNSTYPAPLHDINLNWIHSLIKLHPIVGYSGHERGISISQAAVAIGACIVERHFTLDRNMEGPDHAASLTYDEFKEMVTSIRNIEEALGEGNTRKMSQGEMMNRENLSKSLVAATPIQKGTILEAKHIKVRSPGQGLSPQKYTELLGKKIKYDMDEEDFFFPSDLNEKNYKPKNYQFTHPWGVPVRYHDYGEYHAMVNPNLWEFHLSYSDMDLDISKYLDGEYEQDFVVHAPELFKDSKLMDLASPDDDYRNESIQDTQKVIDITRSLKKYFPKTQRPPIVANIGGFTMDAPLPLEVKNSYYERFADSLTKLNMEGVELIPQTMAPFPWHFGGQRYQNLFVEIDEITKWCQQLNLRMCFDVSHTMLTCNHLKYDFYSFADQISPITAHLHLGDASGVNGEGLQVGNGVIDFDKLGAILNKNCPTASFIPEIWQGHKNKGEGFWIALERLENKI